MSLLDQSSNNVYAAKVRVSVLLDLSNVSNRFNLDADIVDDGHSIFTSGLVESTFYHPRCYWCITEDQKLFVFVGGVESAEQGQSLWNSYTDTPQTGGVRPNTWYAKAAADIRDAIGLVIANRSAIFLCGYSAGGGVVLDLLRQWKPDIPTSCRVTVVSFGSPKANPGYYYNILPVGSCSSFFNSDDPVPFIPPSITHFQRIMSGLSYSQGQNISMYDSWPGGLNIDLNGLVRPMAQPSQLIGPATEQIGAWLRAQQTNTQNSHSLLTYVSRLALAVALLPPTQSVILPFVGRSTHEVVSGPVIRRAIRSTVETQFADASRQNATPVYIPTAKLFTVSRKNKVYYVLFGGQVIAAAPFRRRAHGLARMGNDFLRRLQNEGVVYSDDLSQQFGLYLLAAADPASGIKPTMNTKTSG